MDLSFNSNATTAPAAVHYAFGTHDRVTIEGMEFRPVNYNEMSWLMQVTDGTGLMRDFTHEELRRLASMGRLHHQPQYFAPAQTTRRLNRNTTLISSLNRKQRAHVSKRGAWVAAAREQLRDKKMKMTDDSIQANIAELLLKVTKLVKNLNPLGLAEPGKSSDIAKPPSPRTLRRWLKDEAIFGESGLIDNMSKRGNRNRLLCPETIGLMMRVIRANLTQERRKPRVIHDFVQIAFNEHNSERAAKGLAPIQAPSLSTTTRAIKEIDPFSVMLMQHGLEETRKKFMPVGEGLKLTRPGERVEMDEHTIDLISLMHFAGMWDLFTEDELHALGLDNSKGRWVLTVAMCATTRCILGMVISRGAKATAAIQCLQMVISDKGQWSDAVQARGHWDMHLTPELIVTDNGTAFKSEAFRVACADLGISLEYTKAGMPQQRGRGERFFGTLSNAVPPLGSGRTFSDVVTKGDADPRERAALTFDDLAFALVRWIVDGYHNNFHSGLGETPLQCWRRLTAIYGVTPPPDNRRWRLVFGKEMVRNLSKAGLEILNVKYHSERLALWMNRKGEGKIDVRWHPRDIGAIEVRLGDEWFEIPAVDPMMKGKAAQTWLTAWNRVRQTSNGRSKVDREVVLAAMKAIDERNVTAMAMASLLVNEWDDARIAKAEREMFQGAFPRVATPPASDGKGLGRPIAPPPADTPAQPLKPQITKPRKSNVSFED